MIPKIIHYCWFGNKPLPSQYKNYVDSWKKAFPTYKILEWNENNFPIEKFEYAKEALEEKKYAFVSDVARIYALYEYGGIYFDTDVEVMRNFEDLLKGKEAVLGTETIGETIGTGFMAFSKEHKICKKMLDFYKNNSFKKQDSLLSNTKILAKIIEKEYKVYPSENIQNIGNIIIYPPDYFTAYNGVIGKIQITKNTRCVHHFAASWLPPKNKLKMWLNNIFNRIKMKKK